MGVSLPNRPSRVLLCMIYSYYGSESPNDKEKKKTRQKENVTKDLDT